MRTGHLLTLVHIYYYLHSVQKYQTIESVFRDLFLLSRRAFVVWARTALWTTFIAWTIDNVLIVSSSTVTVAKRIMITVVNTGKELNFSSGLTSLVKL